MGYFYILNGYITTDMPPEPQIPRICRARRPAAGSFTLLDEEFLLKIGGEEAGYIGFNGEAEIYRHDEGAHAVVSVLEFGGGARQIGLGHMIFLADAGLDTIRTALAEDEETLALELLLARHIAVALEGVALDQRAVEELGE
jgi:hypothetical protein